MVNKKNMRILKVRANTGVLRRGLWEIREVSPEIDNLVRAGLAAWADGHAENTLPAEASNETDLEEGDNK